ncbi:MAG: GNAT family N-acetyltransferase [Ferruginibacter sp.]
MLFREAKREDIKQIQVVRNSVKENTLSDPGLVTDNDCEQFLFYRGKGWVCEINHEIVGFSIADLQENNIWALFVRPEYEKQGIGRILHDLMLDWYFSQIRTTVWLGTSPNTKAEMFYRKSGWKEVGVHGKGEIKFEMSFENWRNQKMADNSEDKQLDDPIIPSSENVREEIIPAAETETLNPIQESENMEVHHHPDLHHKPKKWKEYFLEFLMIFLAVTLGFFAENIREHFTDIRKGKEYAISYKEDLVKDTAIIQTNIFILNRDIAGCDSLNYYLENDITKTPADLQKIYQYNLAALGGFSFKLTDRTASQLKNSGGMLLLKKKNVANGILDYWENGVLLDGIQTGAATMRQQARETTYLIFDNRYYSADSDAKGKRMVSADAKLLTQNYLQLAELRNRLTHFKNTLKGPFMKGLQNQKTQAVALIKLIDKEYE